MIAKLYLCFGVVGIASILCWGAALAFHAGGLRHRMRTRVWMVAFCLAALGLLLATVNSSFVSTIEVDRSEEQAEGRERQHVMRQETEKAAREAARSPDVPALSSNIYEAAMQEPAQEFDYKKRGKQQRIVDESARTNVLVALKKTDPLAVNLGRRMKEPDVILANWLDRINLFFSRGTFWLAIGLVIADYFRRFNRTTDHLYPLPLAGQWMDSISRKTHSVLARNATPEWIRGYLENCVRKGETFVYLGPPLSLSQPCRVAVRKLRIFPLDLVTCGPRTPTESCPDDLILESAWFNRSCFAVHDPGRASALLDAMSSFIEWRHMTRASARRTVNIVWNFDETPGALRRMIPVARDMNFKFVLCSATTSRQNAPEVEETL